VAARLTDAAQRAIWARMQRGPFRKRELVDAAVAAGQPNVRAYSAITSFLNELRRKGAVFFEGTPRDGSWTLLPKADWLGAPISDPHPKPVLKAPPIVGPYDPAPEVEGPNNGLTRALAEHLWCDLGGGVDSNTLNSRPVMERRAWLEAADRVLALLLGLGFVGPAGRPRELGFGWSYKWLYEANTWEVVDEGGGFVAMVANEGDVPMFLCAPDMAVAISELLGKYQTRGGIKKSDLDALARSLPSALPGYLSAALENPPTPPSTSGV
jgi:hypothetical protein